jgi:predicted helicase
MKVSEYIDKVNTRYKSGITTEHSFRGDLQNLLETLLPNLLVTNEPTRIKCGAPDYILTLKDIPVGYIEAKDLGADLNHKNYVEQFSRYKASLSNLIITNYLDFQLFKDGVLITTFSIGEIKGNAVVGKESEYTLFETQIVDFSTTIGQTIKSSQKLAEMMAGKAKMLAQVINKALDSDDESMANSSIKEQFNGFKEILINDIDHKAFSDLYAQTIAYGMFAARLHDPTLPTFSRSEAAELIPKSNPFLRKLFQYIAGFDLDERIVWIVDALADIFRATDVAALLNNFGKSTQQNDPIIHFYETFLSEYDPKLRKARGVWYTPEPVVKFIVRAVDDILKTEFGLSEGLADTSKIKIKTDIQGINKQIEQEVHRVQILDPATGTGTFLCEVVKYIYSEKFQNQQGIWNNYVENHLIPRLNGFELLMASYAMAHLKLDLLLSETGFKPTKEQRLKVYLTNSLEEHHPDTGTLFANWLSTEANEANKVKRDSPVMCIIGNPPYSGESANKGEWIMNLMEDYKKEPGGIEKLKERNPKWINDDYVKFLRYGQHFIEKNGSGILAFINPHGFLDNPTFRGMRWNLLKTYDKIYTIDLHGNSKKKETALDGSPDINVFDIMQGVSINIFIKTGLKKSKELGSVYHFDLFGKREFKYNFLNNNSIKTIQYKELQNISPNYFFVIKDFKEQNSYDNGFSIDTLFNINGVGLTTAHDEFVIKQNRNDLLNFYTDFQQSERNEDLLHSKFNVKKKDGWNILQGYDNIKNEMDLNKFIEPISYRPFDNRYVFYEDKLVWRTARKIMKNFLKEGNIGLTLCKQFKTGESYFHTFITNKIIESSFVSNRTSEVTSCFPLYLYGEDGNQQSIDQIIDRVPNLNYDIIKEISNKIGLIFNSEKGNIKDTFSPIDVLDYIYAVLHSPSYREKYKEFLKIDFPRVPYPNDKETFWTLVKLGGEIRQIHLLESPITEKYITQYPIAGNDTISKPQFKEGRVYINETQYFDNVPEISWNFYIGGYQPAQKWLKDRKDRKLEFEDILHYQKIIVALFETDRLMKEIDKIEI